MGAEEEGGGMIYCVFIKLVQLGVLNYLTQVDAGSAVIVIVLHRSQQNTQTHTRTHARTHMNIERKNYVISLS